MHPRIRNSGRVVMVWLLAVAALAPLVGCGTPDSAVQTPPVSTSEPTATQPPTTLDTQTQPAVEPATGSVGEAVEVGTATLTVREAELTDEAFGVKASDGMLIKIEIDVENTGSSALALQTGDWVFEAGGSSYGPAQADRADRRGQRTVGAGKTEDVKVIFDVPSDATTGVLVFTSTDGAVARISVP